MTFSKEVSILTLNENRSFDNTLQCIVEHAKVNLSLQERTLLAFKLIKNPETTVTEYIKEIAKLGKLEIKE